MAPPAGPTRMRISAPTVKRPRPNGFTLVELMVVLAILALAAAAVVLTIPGEEQHVRSEADRLAARLAASRDIAVFAGRTGACDLVSQGYGSARRTGGRWEPVPGRAFPKAEKCGCGERGWQWEV